MDPLTQGALGAAAAQCGGRVGRMRAAALAGAAAGILPDADVFIRSSSDPLLFLDYHRHFTHSLVFIPVGAAIAAGLCGLISRLRPAWRTPARDLWRPCLLGYATHGLLDACTSYGTYLWWPFSHERVAWSVVSIVDPLFTLPLLIGVIWAARANRQAIARVFMAIALAYLAVGALQRGRVRAAAADLAAERGHAPERSAVKPSLGNDVLWRSFYEFEGRLYVDAVRAPWLGAAQVYPGESIAALDPAVYAAQEGLDATRAEDLQRFDRFSSGWLMADPRYPGVVSDFRYSVVPNQIAPLWGVDVGGTPEGEHLVYREFNAVSEAEREAFLGLLWGE